MCVCVCVCVFELIYINGYTTYKIKLYKYVNIYNVAIYLFLCFIHVPLKHIFFCCRDIAFGYIH